jgi:hypothetical protein
METFERTAVEARSGMIKAASWRVPCPSSAVDLDQDAASPARVGPKPDAALMVSSVDCRQAP